MQGRQFYTLTPKFEKIGGTITFDKDVKVEEKHTNMRLRISENKTNSTAKESTSKDLANNAIKQESSSESNDNEEVLNLKDLRY